MRNFNWVTASSAERATCLARPAIANSDRTYVTVKDILANVKREGDTALVRFTQEFDGVAHDSFRVSEEEFAAAQLSLSAEASDAIDTAIANVSAFHAAQSSTDIDLETSPGVRCERVTRPIDSVGLYVPAGTAPLPSTAIMLAVPAAIADCPTRILCTPPGPDGHADAAVLVAAKRAGVSDIFKLGGAQAVAAMAYGTASIPKVNKIFGPGNAWVTAAKSIVSADPDGAAIDMPAGPSEVMVIADGDAAPAFVAADLLSQAEHGPDSQVLLVSPSKELIAATQAAVSDQIETLSRCEVAQRAIQTSSAILVDSLQQAVDVCNAYAPEHLIIQCREPRQLLPDISNAGSVFVGPWTPESVGDYCSGTNHVLPTYGNARSYSGLGVEQFRRTMTIQELTRNGLQALGDTVMCLASLEGLDAHAAAVRIRLGSDR